MELKRQAFNLFQGITPKRDRKVFSEVIKSSVLKCLKSYDRHRFKDINEIKEFTKQNIKWLNRVSVINYLANQYGLKGEISTGIHSLRNRGHPIITSVSTKGYIYSDIDDPNMPENWDSVFNANERRKEIPKSEKKTLENLFIEQYKECIRNHKNAMKKAMIIIAKKHGIEVKN